MKRLNQLNIKRGLLSKLVLLMALFLGSSNAWGEDEIYYDGSTVLTLTNWETTGTVSYSSYGTPRYMYISNGSSASLTSNNVISFSEYKKIVFTAKKLNSTSSNYYIRVKYSNDNGLNWNQYNEYTDVLDNDNFVNFEINLNGNFKIKLECSSVRFQILKYSNSDPYPAPTNFSVSSTTATTATLGWVQAKDETRWKIKYSTKADFNKDTEGTEVIYNYSDSYTYTLTGLTSEVTYYAYICSYYSSDEKYGTWSEKIAITPKPTVTLFDGATTNNYFPLYGYKSNSTSFCRSQFVIPSSDLTSIKNTKITSITFYASQSNVSWGDAKFDVYLKIRDNSTYSSKAYDSGWGEKVISNKSLSIVDGKMVLNFDTPFNYTEGNLMIGIDMITTGASGTCSWYGTETINNVGVYYNYSIYYSTFNPKITITASSTTAPVTLDDKGYTTFACPRPLDLTTTKIPEGLKAYKAEVDAENGKVRFTGIDQTVAANIGILLAGPPNKTYNIPFADSGSDVERNDFLVNSTGGTFSSESGCTYFGYKKNSNPSIFAKFNPSTVAIPTNKAYLKVSTSGEARQLVAVFDDGETTSLREIRNEELGIKNAVFFNLNGQRVAQPTKGLYIVNGKKVAIK